MHISPGNGHSRPESGRNRGWSAALGVTLAAILGAAGTASAAIRSAAIVGQSQPGASEAGEANLRLPDLSTRAVSGHGWTQAADVRTAVLRAGAGIWHGDLRGTEESAGPPQHARNIRADLRDLQNLSDHAGQIPDAAVGVHRRGDRAVFRRAAKCDPLVRTCLSFLRSACWALREATAWRGSAFE